MAFRMSLCSRNTSSHSSLCRRTLRKSSESMRESGIRFGSMFSAISIWSASIGL